MRRLFLLLMLLLIAVPALGSVNVLSGNLSYQQELFSTQGGAVPLGLVLQYNSLDKVAGQVGKGWSHSYEIYLHENSDGTLVLTGGVGKRFYFPDGNGNYVSRTADYSSLTDNGNGTYTINFPNGTVYQFGTDKKLTSITDRHNNTLNFVYTGTTQLTVTDTANRACNIYFDGNGKVDYIETPVQNPVQRRFDFEYHPTSGLLQTVTYPEPETGVARPVWEFFYTAEGLLEYIKDPKGQYSKYEYANGKVIRTVAPEGVINETGAEIADPTPHEKIYTYNSTVQLTRQLTLTSNSLPKTTVTEKDGQPWVYVYNVAEGQLAAKQDPLGNVAEYAYYPDTDPNYGHRQSTLKPMEVSADGLTVKYRLTSYNSYDPNGKPTNITTNVRTITYDATGAPTSTTDGSVFKDLTYAYGSYNRPNSITDNIANTVITIDYLTLGDSREQVTLTAPKINVIDPTGPQTVMIYRTDGQLDEITDPLGRKVDYQYDLTTGLLTSISDPKAASDPDVILNSFSNFDDLGLAQTVTLEGNKGVEILTRSTDYQYDALAQLRFITQGTTTPLITEFDYDAVGNRNLVVDAETKETSFEHNSKGQVTKVTNTLNPGLPEQQFLDTILDYVGAGCASCGSAGEKLKSLTDAKSQKTDFEYDELGRLILETDPLTKSIGYAYYADGRPRQKFLGNSQTGIPVLTYEYDSDGKLLYKKDPQNSNATLASYSYYAAPDIRAGLLLNAKTYAADQTEESSYTIDYYNNGWLKSVDNGTYIIEYEYDDIGRRELVIVRLKQDSTVLHTIDYVYDPTTKEFKQIISDKAGTFVFDYDALGRRSTLNYPNGVVGTYGYDDANQMDWLSGIDYTDGAAGPILSAGYPQHDKVGNRKQRVEDGVATDYQYDDLYRVTQAKTGQAEENFAYDAVGNRESGPTVKDTLYSHNLANQMEQGRKYTYTYDDHGNQEYRYLNTAKTKHWKYSWTPENQLKQAQLVKDSNILRTINFKYDAFGRRIEKEVIDTLATTTTTYVYDGEDIVLQLVDDGSTVSTRQFVHGTGIDETLAQNKDGQNYYYHADGLGSIFALTDSTKGIVQRYTYDTFGMLTSVLDSEFGNAYTYTAREWDRELGLYYYRARFYDPMEGRFISKDPLPKGGNIYTQGVYIPFSQYVEALSNPFAYTENNPVNWGDPSGLMTGVEEGFVGGTLVCGPVCGAIGGVAGGLLVYMAGKAIAEQVDRFCTDEEFEERCEEEWEDAREYCRRVLGSQDRPNGVTGGYLDIESCARGHVSEQCGGNQVEY